LPEQKNNCLPIVAVWPAAYLRVRNKKNHMEPTSQDYKNTDVHEKFAEDIRGAADATNELIEEGVEELARTAEQLNTAFRAAGDFAKVAYEAASEQVVAGAKATDRFVRRRPYESIGIALGVGLLVGFLIKRK
jgi:ElaB/YqjD/DUF883 family membrane-anchored ribosome-binding protein